MIQRHTQMLGIAAVIAAVACSDNTTKPVQRAPGRASLNGVYQCASVRAFYYNAATNSERWRSGRCQDYIAITNPTRADSADTVIFTVSSDNGVRRQDFFPGLIAYDSSTGDAQVTYPDRPPENYIVSASTQIQMTRIVPPFDFTGDGRTDSLEITFYQVVSGGGSGGPSQSRRSQSR